MVGLTRPRIDRTKLLLILLLRKIFGDTCHFVEQLLCDRHLISNMSTPYYNSVETSTIYYSCFIEQTTVGQ